MLRAVGDENGFCSACYTSKYPLEFPRERSQQMALFEKSRA
jgi:hypothetical protein